MTEKQGTPKARWLHRYAIASADLFYSELEQRDVFVYNDPDKGFRIWGEIPGIGAPSAIDLCQIFLEYGMYAHSWASPQEAIYIVSRFGEELGKALAKYMKENPPAEMVSNPGACALMCVLESMNVQFSVQQIGPELDFICLECPIEETAERTGLREVRLAHHGLNAMIQALIHNINDHLAVKTHQDISVPPVFALKTV